MVVGRWWFFYRRGVGSWVEKRVLLRHGYGGQERNEREKRESEREKARLKASERGRFLAFQNDSEKDLSPAPARVGAFCERSPLVRPNSVVAPTRAGAAFGGGVRVENASTIPLSPAPRGFAIFVPKSGRIVRCPSARGRWAWLRVPQTGEIGTPNPAPDGACESCPQRDL